MKSAEEWASIIEGFYCEHSDLGHSEFIGPCGCRDGFEKANQPLIRKIQADTLKWALDTVGGCGCADDDCYDLGCVLDAVRDKIKSLEGEGE